MDYGGRWPTADGGNKTKMRRENYYFLPPRFSSPHCLLPSAYRLLVYFFGGSMNCSRITEKGFIVTD